MRKQITRQILAMVIIAFGLATPAVLTTTHVAAVDLFNNCATDSGGAACTDCKTGAKDTDVCKEVSGQDTTQNPVIRVIKLVINVVSFIAGAASIIALVISGIRLTISNGDSNAIAAARSSIIYALIGIALIVMAQAIVVFVLNKVG